MANLPPEDKINFLIACLKHTEGTPDFAAVAIECGIEKRPQARYQYKSVVEYQTKYLLDGNNKIQLKDDSAIPATPKSAKASTTTGTATASGKKRGRPKKNGGDGDAEETPAKSTAKPRATKKAKSNETVGDAEEDDIDVNMSNADNLKSHNTGIDDED